MQLSEAIRLGAMWRPQGFHAAFTCDPVGTLRSCVLAAAHEALGGSVQALVMNQSRDTPLTRFDTLLQRIVLMPCTCPQRAFIRVRCPCGCGTYLEVHDAGAHRTSVGRILMHLNDHHRWTRERIADWLATIERPEDDVDVRPAAAPQTVPREAIDASDPQVADLGNLATRV